MRTIVLKLLKRSARRYIARHKPYIIGITGSVGKTTCRMIVTQTLRRYLPTMTVSTSPNNFNTEIGLCLSILEEESWSLNKFYMIVIIIKLVVRGLFGGRRYDVLVAEYGIDAPGDMDYLVGIAPPNIAVFTVLDKVHAHQLGSPDGILQEKVKLLMSAKEIVCISAGSQQYLEPYLDDIGVDILRYALDSTQVNGADIWRRSRTVHESTSGLPQASFTIEQGNDDVTSISTNLLSPIDAGYISLGVELAMILERRLAVAFEELGENDHCEYQLQPGRMSLFAGKWGSVIIDSSYSAGPKSMRSLLNTTIMLRNQLYTDFDLVYCLGEMRELGDFSEKEHRLLASVIAQSADRLYLVGKEMKTYLLDELEKIGYNMSHVSWFESSQQLGESLTLELPKRDKRSVVMVKGSQNTIYMEEAIKPILKSPGDVAGLCRQSKSWIKKKKAFFALCDAHDS